MSRIDTDCALANILGVEWANSLTEDQLRRFAAKILPPTLQFIAEESLLRSEVLFEQVVARKAKGTWIPGVGFDIRLSNGALAEAKTVGSTLANNGHSVRSNLAQRAQIKLSNAKWIADHFLVAVCGKDLLGRQVGEPDDKVSFFVIPRSALMVNGELAKSIDIRLTAGGSVELGKYRNYMFRTFDEFLAKVEEISSAPVLQDFSSELFA